MRRSLLLIGAVLMCPGISEANNNGSQNPPEVRFSRAQTAKLAQENVDLKLVNNGAKTELQAALRSGDPMAIEEAKRKLRNSQGVYGRWLENPATARRLMNSPAGSAERKAFERDFALLAETLPQSSLVALTKLGLNSGRVGSASEEKPAFDTSPKSTNKSGGNDAGSGSQSSSNGNSKGNIWDDILDDAWRDFCLISDCSWVT